MPKRVEEYWAEPKKSASARRGKTYAQKKRQCLIRWERQKKQSKTKWGSTKDNKEAKERAIREELERRQREEAERLMKEAEEKGGGRGYFRRGRLGIGTRLN